MFLLLAVATLADDQFPELLDFFVFICVACELWKPIFVKVLLGFFLVIVGDGRFSQFKVLLSLLLDRLFDDVTHRFGQALRVQNLR